MCAALQSKAKRGSMWGRLSNFETGDAGSAEFELRCQKCGNMAQFAANAQQTEAFIDGLVKAMATAPQ
jgi:hypothetical protein